MTGFEGLMHEYASNVGHSMVEEQGPAPFTPMEFIKFLVEQGGPLHYWDAKEFLDYFYTNDTVYAYVRTVDWEVR